MTLKEALDKYVNNSVRIGGTKSGFIFCGTIYKNYKKMLKELMTIEKERYKEYLEKNKLRKATIIKTYKDKKAMIKNQSSITEALADYFETYEHRLEEADKLIDVSKKNYEMVKSVDILNERVKSIYISSIDKAYIIIIDAPLRGSFIDRTEMLKDKRYNEFAQKYNI